MYLSKSKGEKIFRKLSFIAIILMVALISAVWLTSCDDDIDSITYDIPAENNIDTYFTEVIECNTTGGYTRILYDNDTKVMYLVVCENGGRAITPLYNADGTLKIYSEETN